MGSQRILTEPLTWSARNWNKGLYYVIYFHRLSYRDGWMASLTRWTWVCVNSRSWRWTGRPGVLRFMGSQRVGHDWATELNWTELNSCQCWAGRSTSWNQDCQEKHQLPQICRWYHPYGRKCRGTKKPLDESERGEWKSWLKVQLSENEDHGIWSHHFMTNRWGNSGNSVRLYFGGAPKSLQMVTAAMKLKDAYSLEEKLWPT